MRIRVHLALLAMLALSGLARAQSAPFCDAELRQPRPAMAHTLAALAQHEHAQMGGARIEAGGGLVQGGFAEAERSRLPGARLQAWQRVWRYWRAAPDFYAQHMAWMDTLAPSALQRVTLVDQPWSAAFISWLMREAGLGRDQFAFSASHHDYVRAAIVATEVEQDGSGTAYGWRACDLAHTPPRLGDLLCFARNADAGLDRFDALRAAVVQGPVSMHCELVVAQRDHRIQTMGGNVLDTVVLRELDLQQGGSGRLWPAYLQATHGQQQRALAEQPPPGQAEPLWPRTHLNEQPWSLLMQLRAAAWRPAHR